METCDLELVFGVNLSCTCIRAFFFQFLGDKVSERVKAKVITMLHGWTVSLPDEAKICEAYQMLKSQGERDTCHLKTVEIC